MSDILIEKDTELTNEEKNLFAYFGENAKIKPLWQLEKETIETAISSCNGNIPQAAALLKVSPSTIYRKKLSWK